MADYNIIQITPEKVELACMQSKPKPNACPPSNITTINPPCKSEQNVVAIDLVQLRQVLAQALKDVTERLKVYATLLNLKEEAETRYSEDLVLSEKLKQLEEVTLASLEELYNNIEAILREYATKELVNAEITAVQDTIEQVELLLIEHITLLGSELDVNVDNLQNKIEDVHDTLEQELEEGLSSKVDTSMFDSVLQNANTAVGQLQSKTSTLEQEMDSVEAAVENLEIDLNNLNTEIEQKSVIIGSSINDLSQRLDELQNCTALTAATPVVDCTDSQDNSYTLFPNKKYIFGTKSALTIALELPADTTIVNHYYFEFISGSTATTLSLPASIKWIAGPSIKSNKTYLISIENNLGIIQEWP